MWVVVIVAATPSSAAAAPLSYLILLPREGAVTDATTLLRVQQQGGAISTTFRFTVDIDRRGVDEQGRLTDAADAFAFSVPGGAVRDISLRSLPVGLHTVRVLTAESPAGTSVGAPAPVHFTVGPGYANRGKVSVPFVIGVVAFGLLLFLSRRRIAGFARSFERPDDDDDDDAAPPGRRHGWGDDGPDDPWA
jgi:hypothetical protein